MVEAPKLTVQAQMVITKNNKDRFFRINIPMEDILRTGVRKRRSRRPPTGREEAEPTVKEVLDSSDIVGDGKATVAVSVDMGEKDFGNGFSGGMVISLTCQQSNEGIEAAKDVTASLLRRFVPEIADLAHDLYEEKTKRRPLSRKN